jgi:hypothetical protein
MGALNGFSRVSKKRLYGRLRMDMLMSFAKGPSINFVVGAVECVSQTSSKAARKFVIETHASFRWVRPAIGWSPEKEQKYI